MRHFIFAFSIAALLFGGLGGARADAISPIPERCPEGSAGEFCHGPPRCAPLSCEIDTDCAAGQRCLERPLCVRDQSCSGGWGGPGTPVPHVDAACPDGACEGWGTSCQTLKVCVAGTNTDGGSPTPDAGSASDAGSSADAGGSSSDAGGTSIDAGGTTTDAGSDGGGARTDSGPSRQDAGGVSTTGGGCCSAVGARSGAGGALFVGLMIVTALRRSRRR